MGRMGECDVGRGYLEGGDSGIEEDEGSVGWRSREGRIAERRGEWDGGRERGG